MKSLDTVARGLDKSCVTGHRRESFKMDSGAICLCASTFLRILLDPSQEICECQHLSPSSGVEYTITTSRVSDMFNTHMQSLLDISVADNLLHGDSDGALCDVEYHAGLSVVELVWQPLLLSRVTDDIDNVADFVCFELVCQNGLGTGRGT